MWYSPTQRRGFASCSPVAYAINSVGCWCANIGVVLVGLAINGVLVAGLISGWSWTLAIIVAIGLGIPILGYALMGLAWWMARRQGYHFDPDTDTCTWKRGRITGDRQRPAKANSVTDANEGDTNRVMPR